MALTRLKNSPRGCPSTVTSATDPTGPSSVSDQGRRPSALPLLVAGAAVLGARNWGGYGGTLCKHGDGIMRECVRRAFHSSCTKQNQRVWRTYALHADHLRPTLASGGSEAIELAQWWPNGVQTAPYCALAEPQVAKPCHDGGRHHWLECHVETRLSGLELILPELLQPVQ